MSAKRRGWRRGRGARPRPRRSGPRRDGAARRLGRAAADAEADRGGNVELRRAQRDRGGDRLLQAGDSCTMLSRSSRRTGASTTTKLPPCIVRHDRPCAGAAHPVFAARQHLGLGRAAVAVENVVQVVELHDQAGRAAPRLGDSRQDRIQRRDRTGRSEEGSSTWASPPPRSRPPGRSPRTRAAARGPAAAAPVRRPSRTRPA
jgi:hypothetical protein